MMQAEIQNDSINNQKMSSSLAVHDMVRTHMRDYIVNRPLNTNYSAKWLIFTLSLSQTLITPGFSPDLHQIIKTLPYIYNYGVMHQKINNQRITYTRGAATFHGDLSLCPLDVHTYIHQNKLTQNFRIFSHLSLKKNPHNTETKPLWNLCWQDYLPIPFLWRLPGIEFYWKYSLNANEFSVQQVQKVEVISSSQILASVNRQSSSNSAKFHQLCEVRGTRGAPSDCIVSFSSIKIIRTLDTSVISTVIKRFTDPV